MTCRQKSRCYFTRGRGDSANRALAGIRDVQVSATTPNAAGAAEPRLRRRPVQVPGPARPTGQMSHIELRERSNRPNLCKCGCA